jgi:hypothetical protein
MVMKTAASNAGFCLLTDSRAGENGVFGLSTVFNTFTAKAKAIASASDSGNNNNPPPLMGGLIFTEIPFLREWQTQRKQLPIPIPQKQKRGKGPGLSPAFAILDFYRRFRLQSSPGFFG